MPVPSFLNSVLGGAWTLRPLDVSDFSATWRADGPDGPLFVKTVPLARASMLEAEADGLEALAASGTVRTPQLAGCWRDEERGQTILAMEWLDLARPDHGFGARFGRALAALHNTPPPDGGGRFGWHRHNVLGATPQLNTWSPQGGREGWLRFLTDQRLGALRERLARRGAPPALLMVLDPLIDGLECFFPADFSPRASLIHGDLWSGNRAMLKDGNPVVFDPAVSISDPEAELAMLELFGPAPAGFAEAYAEAGLLPDASDEGAVQRRKVYQLYHLLNHALLYGGGYMDQAERVARALLPR